MEKLTKAQSKQVESTLITLERIQAELYDLSDCLEANRKPYLGERIKEAAFNFDEIINTLENAKNAR